MKAEIFNKIHQTLRFNNWWQYKIPPLVALFLFAKILSVSESNWQILEQFILVFLWMISAASFGYYVNDFSDIEEDNLAGKQNLVQVLHYKYRIVVFFLIGLVVIGFQLALNSYTSVPFILSILQMALFVLYSVRPVRLKDRFVAGVVCDALYAHLLPALIVFTTALYLVEEPVLFKLLLLLSAWQLLQGTRNILLHHISDLENDRKSATNNLAAIFGSHKLLRLTNYVIAPAEAICISYFLYTIQPGLLLISVLAAAGVWLIRFLLSLNKGSQFILQMDNQDITLWLLNGFYEQVMPVVAIAVFCWQKRFPVWLTGLLLAGYFLLFPVFIKAFLKGVSVSAFNQLIYRTKAVFFDAPKKLIVNSYWKAVTFYWQQYAAYWKRQHEKNPNIRYHFCTVSNSNYLHKVLALHESLMQQTIKSRLHVLVTDSGSFDQSKFPETIIFYHLNQVQDQPFAADILSKYALEKDELRWCMKPVFMHYLLDKGIVDSVLYVDNDICFFQPFFSLYDFVGSCGVWLTPHWRCMNPFEDGHVFKDSFKDGMFNAGFVGASGNGKKILEWWAMANSYMCEKNRPEGMWDDQKYLDMLPVRFSNVGIVRHMGCNVAVWNKRDCIRERKNGEVLIVGEYPIVFIHFTNDTMDDIEYDKYGGDPLLKPYLHQYQQSLEKFKLLLGV